MEPTDFTAQDTTAAILAFSLGLSDGQRSYFRLALVDRLSLPETREAYRSGYWATAPKVV